MSGEKVEINNKPLELSYEDLMNVDLRLVSPPDVYNAINVNKVSDIPCNFEGIMGVPITFLDKYNPEQ